MSKKRRSGIWETIKTIAYAVLVALFVRTFAYEPFNIPSGSMIPTLLEGDYLFVSKFSYGYSRYSLPLSLKLFSGRIAGQAPKRGDVAVFRLPIDDDTDYIKRIVGLPGDRIQVKNGVLFINDQKVKRYRVDDFVEIDFLGRERRIPQYRETLPNGPSYHVLDSNPNSTLDNTGVFTVPASHFFAMGDNRDNSIDSRVPPERRGVGFIPGVNLIGRADVLFFSTDGSAPLWEVWNWFDSIRWKRIFQTVD
ncbi:MAG: signal peptidase I [Alphaproteobacteria bacterium]